MNGRPTADRPLSPSDRVADRPSSRNGVNPPAEAAGDSSSPPRPEISIDDLLSTPSRRRWPAFVLGGLVGGAGALAAVTLLNDGDDAEALTEEIVELATAPVEQRDVLEEIEWDGTLGYGEPIAVAVDGGTVTSAVDAGRELVRGDVLASVDGAPVVVMYGDTPMWRDLTIGDEGDDVRQLEANLAVLGHDPDATVDIDTTYTANTAAMVARWQEELGVEATGEVGRREVVMVPGPSTVISTAEVGQPAGADLAVVAPRSRLFDLMADIDGVITDVAPPGTELTEGTVAYRIGDEPVRVITTASAPVTTDAADAEDVLVVVVPAGLTVDQNLVADGELVVTGGPVLTASSALLSVEVTVDVSEADEFELDEAVGIELSDESTVDGRVVDIGPVIQSADPQASPTVTVRIELQGGELAADGAGAAPVEGPVTVTGVGEEILGATVIPVRSLLALAEGGFAVEKVGADGSTTLVGVELGTFDDSVVVVTSGDLVPGDEVVVPR